MNKEQTDNGTIYHLMLKGNIWTYITANQKRLQKKVWQGLIDLTVCRWMKWKWEEIRRTSCKEEKVWSEGLGREEWMKLKLRRRSKVKKVACLDMLNFLILFLISQILCRVGRECIYREMNRGYVWDWECKHNHKEPYLHFKHKILLSETLLTF